MIDVIVINPKTCITNREQSLHNQIFKIRAAIEVSMYIVPKLLLPARLIRVSYPPSSLIGNHNPVAHAVSPWPQVKAMRQNHLRQRLKNNLIPLIMTHEPSLQHPSQSL